METIVPCLKYGTVEGNHTQHLSVCIDVAESYLIHIMKKDVWGSLKDEIMAQLVWLFSKVITLNA